MFVSSGSQCRLRTLKLLPAQRFGVARDGKLAAAHSGRMSWRRCAPRPGRLLMVRHGQDCSSLAPSLGHRRNSEVSAGVSISGVLMEYCLRSLDVSEPPQPPFLCGRPGLPWEMGKMVVYRMV